MSDPGITDERGLRHVGAEEELLLVSARTPSRPVPGGESVLADQGVEAEHELKLEQVEIASEPASVLAELGLDLRRRRAGVIEAAALRGIRVVALASSPGPTTPTPTPDERYQRMGERFALVARDQLTCGTHVHVAVESRAHGVAAIDRIRPWLAALTAISANSPFWSGQDTGYASYRTVMWGRWPTAGPTELFGEESRYDEAVADLVVSGAALDLGMIYFDARLSANQPTVEVRVADVCQDVTDTVLLAALTRALVETALQDAAEAPAPVRTSLLRAAAWRAALRAVRGAARPDRGTASSGERDARPSRGACRSRPRQDGRRAPGPRLDRPHPRPRHRRRDAARRPRAARPDGRRGRRRGRAHRRMTGGGGADAAPGQPASIASRDPALGTAYPLPSLLK